MTLQKRAGTSLHNIPAYNFPATSFAYINDDTAQTSHVLSEAGEVCEAISALAENEGAADLLIHFWEEMADLTHSLETFWRVMERMMGQEFVQDLFTKVIEKNRTRGYYDVGDAPDPWGDR